MSLSVASVVDALRNAGLVPEDVLDTFTESSGDHDDATIFAKQLVKGGHLTPFQAKFIVGGKAASLVLGPYVVVEMIGKGGMGYVYKAEHRRMRRMVAVKVIAKSALSSPEAVRRFEREVQAAALLEHPNIVTAFDAGDAGGTHYLAMQYVEGSNLHELVRSEGPQPVGRAIDWILQAAQGLAYAHDKGLVHRDIKPGNLLLDRDGIIKIMDLGLARLSSLDADQDQLTGSGQMMGTVDYMAPEQAMDTRQADARSDVYSLGVTLWFFLTARVLFPGETPMQRLMARLQAPPPSLCSLRRDVSPELDAVFQRMVAKDPGSRLQSMREVIDALRDAHQNGHHFRREGTVLPGSRRSIEQLADQTTRMLPQVPVSPDTATTIYPGGDDINTRPVVTSVSPRRSRPGRASRFSPVQTTAAASVAGAVILTALAGFLTRQLQNPPVRKPVEPSAPLASSEAAASVEAITPDDAGIPVETTPPVGEFRHTSGPMPANAPLEAANATAIQEAWSRHLGVSVEHVSSIGMPLMLIPPGSFMLVERDVPAEATVSKPFFLGKAAVTQGQWRNVMGNEPWRDQPFVLDDVDAPATYVSCDDAIAFCRQLTRMEHEAGLLASEQTYRLPTEIEWELACRAGSVTRWWFGDDEAQFDDHGWYGGGFDGSPLSPVPGGNVGDAIYPRPVAQKLPNPWGLHDMHGNVWEWSASRFDLDPVDPEITAKQAASIGPHTLRGGCCGGHAFDSRSAIRDMADPNDAHRWDVGFRVVLSPP